MKSQMLVAILMLIASASLAAPVYAVVKGADNHISSPYQ